MEKLDCIVKIYTDDNGEKTAFVMPSVFKIGDTPYDWSAKVDIPINAVNPDELYNEITKAVNGRDTNLLDENFVLEPRTPLYFTAEAFIKDEILYNGLVASIESVLRETIDGWDPFEYTETAQKIADRIIGREWK